MPRDADSWMRTILLVLGLVLGISWRVQGIGEMPLFGDEYHTGVSGDPERLPLCERGYGEILTTFDVVGSHVVVPLLQRLAMDVFGDGVVSFRLPALLPAILTLLLMYPLARRLVGATPALLATLALAASPMHVYYSRFGRAYALLVLLGLLLVAFMLAALRSERRARGLWVATLVCAILLPYTHLSSAGFVAGIGLAGMAIAWKKGGSARAALVPGAVFGGAALACLFLFLPLMSQVRAFVDSMPGDRPYGWFGIPVLLAGGNVAAVVWLVALPLGAVLLCRRRFETSLVASASILGPLVVLLTTRPHGMEFAYSRYLLNGLPFCLMVIAWGLCALLRRILSGEGAADRSAVALGVVLVGATHLTGPQSPSLPADGSYGNTYLEMRSLPAFDAPSPGLPAFYATLTGEPDSTRIVLVQPLLSRAVLYYRNIEQQVGKQVLTGWLEPELPRALRGGPYVNVRTIEAGDADYLIVHRDLRRDVDDYWLFVYLTAWPDVEEWGDRGFMERHKASFVAGQPTADPDNATLMGAFLRDRLGPAFYKDESVLVWKLDT